MFILRRKSRYPRKLLTRLHSTDAPLASSVIRNRFIEYFVNENDHTFLRSSPIRPISDATIPFVNAGMVQFKSVLQGRSLPPTPRAANSQKCARVGGKHNDLDTVGMDGYHHTFFEMLGNWSFGSCNKLESCQMAWELLTGPYGLHPSRLYVTYFGGDSKMNLEPDLECREVWRKLGVFESHILPFGSNYNFWEMGLVGPCGPCTEIHVDHIPGRMSAGDRVNAGLSDVTELWNIVFIQFNRNSDGSLDALKESHVDTGMGFERLVALLNGSKSNYDTDLFQPLLKATEKISGCPPYSGSFDVSDDAFQKDRAYRILCDHSRLLTVALADGVVPHYEHKLRWVLRRALNIAQQIMKSDEKLLVELSNHVAESLHSIYPEVGKNLSKVQRVILNEAEVYKALKLELPKSWLKLIKENPQVENLLQFGSNPTALASAFKKMSESESQEVSSSLAFHLYESHGMNADLISELASFLGKTFNVEDYEQEIERAKSQSKLSTACGKIADSIVKDFIAAKIPETYDNLMYEYDLEDSNYAFPTVSSKVVGLLVDGKLQSETKDGIECGVLLDRTNFYHTAGGQVNDVGEVISKSGQQECSLSVKEVSKIDGYVIHFGSLNGSMKVGDEVITQINPSRRTACMRNHTLAHLINGEMQHLFDAPLQEKCVIQPSFLKLTYFLHGEEIDAYHIEIIERAVKSSIEDRIRVNRYTVTAWELPTATSIVPDETYPVENIHIIDIKRGNKIISREACCGTHVLNAGDIGEFCIVEVMKSKKTCICAVTGSEAKEAILNSQKLSNDVSNFSQDLLQAEKLVNNIMQNVQNTGFISELKSAIQGLSKVHKKYTSIKKFIQENSRRFSYVSFAKADTSMKQALSKIHAMARLLTELEVQRKAKDLNFMVHSLQLSKHLEKVPLGKYTRLVDVPVMLFSFNDTELKVRCCIPQDLISETFNAVAWMNDVMSHLIKSDQDAVVSHYKHEGQTLAVQTRSIVYKYRVNSTTRKERCLKAQEAAEQFAERQFGKAKKSQKNV